MRRLGAGTPGTVTFGAGLAGRDCLLSRHQRDALGTVQLLMRDVPKVVLDECGLAEPVPSLHDRGKAGVVGPG